MKEASPPSTLTSMFRNIVLLTHFLRQRFLYNIIRKIYDDYISRRLGQYLSPSHRFPQPWAYIDEDASSRSPANGSRVSRSFRRVVSPYSGVRRALPSVGPSRQILCKRFARDFSKIGSDSGSFAGDDVRVFRSILVGCGRRGRVASSRSVACVCGKLKFYFFRRVTGAEGRL